MNYKHLHYFWMAARSGGIARAGERLHTTPQTLSGQIKLLEERLGRRLFRRQGRELALTDDGRVALGYADEIFALGSELEAALRAPAGAERVAEFHVGVSDAVPKSLAAHLLQPALAAATPLRLIVREGKLEDLLATLAVHRLDLVLADAPLPRHLSVRAFNHPLGATGVSFFATEALRRQLGPGRFPKPLNGAPMLWPGAGSALRAPLEEWLARHRVQPRVVGEFDDSALAKAFGRAGHGVFTAPSVLREEVCAQFGVQWLGEAEGLAEQFYAISSQRRITHPGVAAITEAARGTLLAA